MGWAHSVDLRERVIAVFDAEDMTDEQVAAFFNVGEATVHRWKRLKREMGTLEHKPFGGGMPPRVGPEHHELVREIVREKPDLTLQEVAWEFHRRVGQSVSRSAMGRTLANPPQVSSSALWVQSSSCRGPGAFDFWRAVDRAFTDSY